MNNKKTALIIMDGFGIPEDLKRSAILKENTKNLEHYMSKFPHTKIRASEEYVGLPPHQAGTSEVGHMTIGSGRVSFQPLVRINREIESGEFFKNEELNKVIDYCKTNHKKLHLIGLPSDGGIHSHISHLFALLDLCKMKNFYEVYIHFIGDGRDTSPKSIIKYLDEVSNYTKKIGVGSIASIVGRFYALDRDKNWDRNKLSYNLWVKGEGRKFSSYKEAIDSAYSLNETDEFIKPIVLMNDNEPISLIEEGDGVISYNFRADRERQLAYVMVEDNKLDFVEDLKLYFVTMTEYDEHFKKVHVAYKTTEMTNILSEVLSNNGIKQVKIAETEKYAHLTFFFNAGKQDTFKNEDRILINSEKMVSYAPFPQMSAREIADKALEVLDNYDFIAINFANCDMVGHSGDKEATKRAVEVVDECVHKVTEAVLRKGGQGIITADHGNADIMVDENGERNTSHTTALVPVIVFGTNARSLREEGTLADIAPTLLEMMDIDIPKEMTGKSLIVK